MRNLWAKKLGWDEIVPIDIQVCWSKLCNDTTELFSMPVSRMCVSVDEENSLYIFTFSAIRSIEKVLHLPKKSISIF